MRPWMETPLTTLLQTRRAGAICLSLVLATTATPVAAQSAEEVGGIVAAMIGLPLILGLVIAVVLYLASLYKTLATCAPANRSLAPGLVWLNLIPVFSAIWIFVTVVSVASSLRREHAQRGIASDAGHGFGPGLAFAILGLLCDISALLLSPVFFVPFALAALVLWIIHWFAVVDSRQALERAQAGDAGSAAREGEAEPADGHPETPDPGRPPPAPRPGPGANPGTSTGTVVGIVAGVVGLIVIGGVGLLIMSVLANRGDRLKAVSLETDGLFVPDVVAVLHNTGKGGYFDFYVEADGDRMCEGGRTFIAADERRRIRFSCPALGSHSGQYRLNWVAR